MKMEDGPINDPCWRRSGDPAAWHLCSYAKRTRANCGGSRTVVRGASYSKRLPAGVRLAGEGEMFHWSGENSERSRIKAGRDLLEHLLELETEGRGYHLVGHSHGGSVIWHALCRARFHRKELTSLRSWSTVGTPYLQHRTRRMWHALNIINLLLGRDSAASGLLHAAKTDASGRGGDSRAGRRHHAGPYWSHQIDAPHARGGSARPGMARSVGDGDGAGHPTWAATIPPVGDRSSSIYFSAWKVG